MTSISRQPATHEYTMWPDALPASVVVPAGYTWHVPQDLDLADTDLIVNGDVLLASAQPVAATETSAGLVELATDAEAVAGISASRAITPANLTAAVHGVLFDGVSIAVDGEATDEVRLVTLTATSAGVPVTTRWCCSVGLVDQDLNSAPSDVVFGVVGGVVVLWSEHGYGQQNGQYMTVMSEADGVMMLNVNNGSIFDAYVRIVVVLPVGGVVISDIIVTAG